MSVILEAHDLVKRYPLGEGQVEALRGISLSVEKGEFVAIMGASGSGKSTMLQLLGGLDLLGLSAKANHSPDQLSAGEQQRVALARALATEPAIILADEPTGNLDYTTGTEILDLLWDSCDRLGQTIVLVTHDARAAAYADRVLVVRDGALLDEVKLGRRADHQAGSLIGRLAELGL